MNEEPSENELASSFMETGKHHHKAYEFSDGADPEWVLFYAGYLQTRSNRFSQSFNIWLNNEFR
jgi:hypothetical protein